MLGAVGKDEGEGEKVPPPGLALPLPLDGAVADIVLHGVPPAGDCVRTPLSEAPLIDAQALPLRGAEAGADKEKEGVPLSDGAAEPVAMALPLLAPLGGALAESVPLAPPLDEGDAGRPRGCARSGRRGRGAFARSGGTPAARCGCPYGGRVRWRRRGGGRGCTCCAARGRCAATAATAAGGRPRVGGRRGGAHAAA